jgi:hypothetical protein
MRIPSGVTDQYIYFVAVDETDLKTRETGLSSFTVRRSRNGGASAAYTTPTINETDSSNMPGVYELLLDEDMTIDSGDDSQEVCLHITATGMAPVTRVFELYRNTVTAGATLAVDASGNGAADVIEWLGTAAQGASGRPQVDLELWLGSAPNALISGRVDSNPGAMQNNVVTAAAVADNALDAAAFAADTGLKPTRTGTAQGGAAGSLTLDASASGVTDFYEGSLLVTTGGTGVGQVNMISAYNGTTKVATVARNWKTTPDNTTTFAVLPMGPADLYAILGVTVSTSTAQLGVNVVSTASGAITATSLAADAIGASELAADAVTEIATGVWAAAARTLTALDEDNTTLDLDATIRAAVGLASANLDTQLDALPTAAENTTAVWAAGTRTLTAIDEDNTTLDINSAVESAVATALATYDPPTNAELVSEINAVQADIAALNNLSAAQVNAEVDTALTDIHLDHLLATAYDPASKPGAADALLNELVENDGGVARYTANALEQAPTGGSAPSAADIADAVWEEAIADHSGTSGSTAEQLAAAGAAGDPWATALPGAYSAGQAGKIVGDNLNATVSSRATQASVDTIDSEVGVIDGIVDSILVDTAEIGAAGAGLTAITAKTDNLPSDPADASVIAGRFDTLDTSVADLPTNAELATALGAADDAVLTAIDALPTNAELATALGTADDAVLAQIALVKAVTDKLDDTLEDDGGTFRFTENALEEAPTGGSAPTADQNADALLDRANAVETGMTVRQALRLNTSVLGGKASGGGSGTETFRNAVADSKDRVVSTNDASGNRTSVVTDLD